MEHNISQMAATTTLTGPYPEFNRKIILTDKVHFHLGRYGNKQNCRIWGSENSRAIVEKPLHPKRVTVWCGLWSGGAIGSYFFENEAGVTVTVNGLRYREMINDFSWPELGGWIRTTFTFNKMELRTIQAMKLSSGPCYFSKR